MELKQQGDDLHREWQHRKGKALSAGYHDGFLEGQEEGIQQGFMQGFRAGCVAAYGPASLAGAAAALKTLKNKAKEGTAAQ